METKFQTLHKTAVRPAQCGLVAGGCQHPQSTATVSWQTVMSLRRQSSHDELSIQSTVSCSAQVPERTTCHTTACRLNHTIHTVDCLMLNGRRTNIIALAKLGNGLSDLHEILKEDANLF